MNPGNLPIAIGTELAATLGATFDRSAATGDAGEGGAHLDSGDSMLIFVTCKQKRESRGPQPLFAALPFTVGWSQIHA